MPIAEITPGDGEQHRDHDRAVPEAGEVHWPRNPGFAGRADDHADERHRDQTGDPRHRVVDRRTDAALRRVDGGEDRRRQRRHGDRQAEAEHDQTRAASASRSRTARAPSPAAGSRPRRSSGPTAMKSRGPCLPASVPNRRARKNDSTGSGSVARPAVGRRHADGLLQEQRDDQRAEGHRGVEEHRREIADREVARGEESQRHHRVRRCAAPTTGRRPGTPRRGRARRAPRDAARPSRCSSMSAYTAPVEPDGAQRRADEVDAGRRPRAPASILAASFVVRYSVTASGTTLMPKTHRQLERVDEQPAERRARPRTPCPSTPSTCRWRAACARAGEPGVDHRQRAGHQERRADALQAARGDQHPAGRRERAQQRCDGEHRQAPSAAPRACRTGRRPRLRPGSARRASAGSRRPPTAAARGRRRGPRRSPAARG